MFEPLVVKGGVRSAEREGMVLVMQTFKLSGVEYHMGKPFTADPVSKIFRGSRFSGPLRKRVFMIWVGSQSGPIEMEGPGFANEEKFGVRRQVLLYKGGCLVVVDRSLGIFGAGLVSKSDILR